MSDETPDTETPDTETPDTETPDTETPEAVPASGAPAAGDSGDVATGDRRGVFVPRWLAILIGLVLAVGLVGGGGFLLGRETGDDHDGRQSEHSEGPTDSHDAPSRPDNAPQTPNRPQVPNLPPTTQGRLLLGVAVEQADGGAGVVRVTSGTPADDAGIQVGDVITEVDGEAISGPAQLSAAIRAHQSGDEVSITYERNGESTTVSATLADLESDTNPAA